MSSSRSVSDTQCKAKALFPSMNHVVGFEYGMRMSLLLRKSNGQEPEVSTNGEVGMKNEAVCEPGEWRMNGQQDKNDKSERSLGKEGALFSTKSQDEYLKSNLISLLPNNHILGGLKLLSCRKLCLRLILLWGESMTATVLG